MLNKISNLSISSVTKSAALALILCLPVQQLLAFGGATAAEQKAAKVVSKMLDKMGKTTTFKTKAPTGSAATAAELAAQTALSSLSDAEWIAKIDGIDTVGPIFNKTIDKLVNDRAMSVNQAKIFRQAFYTQILVRNAASECLGELKAEHIENFEFIIADAVKILVNENTTIENNRNVSGLLDRIKTSIASRWQEFAGSMKGFLNFKDSCALTPAA